jgi:hypothetical protein
VNYYQPDFALVAHRLETRSSGTIEELRSALDEIDASKKLKTNGAFRSKIDEWKSGSNARSPA